MKYTDFPNQVGRFVKDKNTCKDPKANWNYVGYSSGNDLGYVTAEDVAAGKPVVRKLDQVKPEGRERKVAVPSKRVW